MTVKTTVRNSPIEGVGVFAGEHIQAGTVIWILDKRFDLCFDLEAISEFPQTTREYLVVCIT
ncbi:MAG: hypothetical protein AAFW82_06220 [Pseudomonadota bacterium]